MRGGSGDIYRDLTGARDVDNGVEWRGGGNLWSSDEPYEGYPVEELRTIYPFLGRIKPSKFPLSKPTSSILLNVENVVHSLGSSVQAKEQHCGPWVWVQGFEGGQRKG